MGEPLPLRAPTKRDKRSSARAIVAPAEPDPLAEVEYTGDLEVDAESELDALQAAFRDRRRREDRRFKQSTDSEFWLALCFEDREQKEAFLSAFALSKMGDKYLDGRKVAAALGVNIQNNKE